MTETTTGTAISNNLWVSPPMPEKLHQSGACPKCGAPIYIDAKLVKKNKVVGLPTPYFTCQCRWQTATPAIQTVPVPYIPTLPLPSPWSDPKITWTVGNPNTTAPHPNYPQTTGVLHQKPMPGIICMNMARSFDGSEVGGIK